MLETGIHMRSIAAVCALIGLVLAAPVEAQGGSVNTRAVLAGGLSFAGDGPETSGGVGLSAHIGVRHQRGPFVFSGRAGMNGGGSAPFSGAGNLIDRFDEVAALVGYAINRSQSAQAVLSTGLAVVSGERVTSEDGSRQTRDFPITLGIPVELALSAPGPSSGFGLVVHANFNPEETFGAIVVTYLIGGS